jgi:hypothetical protein
VVYKEKAPGELQAAEGRKAAVFGGSPSSVTSTFATSGVFPQVI